MAPIFDQAFLDSLLQQAQSSPRLRASYDLRTSADDQSQRIFNALIPGTEVPVHRHPASSETVIVLSGHLTEVMYDDNGQEVARCDLNLRDGHLGTNIPAGQWHGVEVHEPTVILEMKDGPYAPLTEADTMKLS